MSKSPTTSSTVVPQEEIKPQDVLCGRGGELYCHPGNEHFRNVVGQFRNEYLLAGSKKEKRNIATCVVNVIHQQTPAGRFLAKIEHPTARKRRRKKTNQEPEKEFWYEITNEKAYEKASQALRENGPALKKALVSQNVAKLELQKQFVEAVTAKEKIQIKLKNGHELYSNEQHSIHSSGSSTSGFNDVTVSEVNALIDHPPEDNEKTDASSDYSFSPHAQKISYQTSKAQCAPCKFHTEDYSTSYLRHLDRHPHPPRPCTPTSTRRQIITKSSSEFRINRPESSMMDMGHNRTFSSQESSFQRSQTALGPLRSKKTFDLSLASSSAFFDEAPPILEESPESMGTGFTKSRDMFARALSPMPLHEIMSAKSPTTQVKESRVFSSQADLLSEKSVLDAFLSADGIDATAHAECRKEYMPTPTRNLYHKRYLDCGAAHYGNKNARMSSSPSYCPATTSLAPFSPIKVESSHFRSKRQKNTKESTSTMDFFSLAMDDESQSSMVEALRHGTF